LKEPSDEYLMSNVAKGDLDLLKVLFERHHKHLYNFLYKMSGDQMLSEDITQDVFYKVMKYRASYNNGKFVSWLFTIARNCLTTHYRRNTENHENIDDLNYSLHKEEVKEDYSHLQIALNKELIVLNRFNEIKYDELAQIVGSTPGAIKTKVSRAIKKLKAVYFENI